MSEDTSSHSGTFLENIALCFSGGGYRASCFSLGVLSYFHQIDLLDKVKGLSTVSGGTITGVMFAHHQAKGSDFPSFYKMFYDFHESDLLLNNALGKFENKEIWKPLYKKRSLINSFSLSYTKLLTDDTLSELMDSSTYLEDYCFNATDFSFGLAFRFQKEGLLGNYRLNKKELDDQRGDLKLADIIASSSCFPVGFAPMIFPDDYLSRENPTYVYLKQQDYYKEGIGILDGGIVDNQGIGSTILANNRRKEDGKKEYDLIMVCDVGSYKMEPWKQSDLDTAGGNTIKSILMRLKNWLNRLGWPILSVLLGVSMTIVGVLDIWPKLSDLLIYSSAFFTLVGISLFAWKGLSKALFWWIKYTVKKVVPVFYLRKMEFFDEISVRLFRRMLQERLSSGLLMVNEVFLNQIRRLNYDLFYASEKLKNKRATALIYMLSEGDYKKSGDIPEPGEKIFAVAEIAKSFKTTLWFTKEDVKVERLKNVVACGQFTACYTLLKYVSSYSGTDVSNDQLTKIKNRLTDDWNKFIEDPYWLWTQYHNSN